MTERRRAVAPESPPPVLAECAIGDTLCKVRICEARPSGRRSPRIGGPGLLSMSRARAGSSPPRGAPGGIGRRRLR